MKSLIPSLGLLSVLFCFIASAAFASEPVCDNTTIQLLAQNKRASIFHIKFYKNIDVHVNGDEVDSITASFPLGASDLDYGSRCTAYIKHPSTTPQNFKASLHPRVAVFVDSFSDQGCGEHGFETCRTIQLKAIGDTVIKSISCWVNTSMNHHGIEMAIALKEALNGGEENHSDIGLSKKCSQSSGI